VGKESSQANQIKRFYEIEQAKLILDFEKITLFTTHPTSLGSFRERRLRQYLKDFTPRQLSVESGFVSTWEPLSGRITDKQSRQIDCLVFDATKRQMLLATDDFAIIEPESLYAAIEIKSSLTFYREKSPSGKKTAEYPLGITDDDGFRWAGTLVDALKNIASLSSVIDRKTAGIFQGVFAYNMNFDWNNLYHAFDNNELQTQLGINHVDQLPHGICVPGSLFISFSPYDMFETAPHHDEWTSHFNYIGALGEAPAYPLQFFTTYFTNQVNLKLTARPADSHGLFSATGSAVEIWSHHFDLNSAGYDDQ